MARGSSAAALLALSLAAGCQQLASRQPIPVMTYKTPNLFVVAASDSSNGQTVRFNFERRELVSWTLTSVSLP